MGAMTIPPAFMKEFFIFLSQRILGRRLALQRELLQSHQESLPNKAVSLALVFEFCAA